MEESHLQLEYLQELPKANPIQKKTIVQPRSILPQLPLPSFRYSQEEVELAPTFSVLDQKEQHTLRETNLSKLFEDPLYQSTPRYANDANNLKFACLKAYYTESGLHPPPLPLSDPPSPELTFQSRFQSGNLAYAQRGEVANEYLLLLQKDINTSRCTQWFFFRVHNGKTRGRVRFHILNLLKNYSSFENGMKISQCRESSGYCWARGGEDITYLRNNIKLHQEKTYYTLSFTYLFDREDDVTYFAHSPPYTFSMMDRHLLNISNNPQLNSQVKRKTLAESPGGNYIDMLTITNFKLARPKKVVFITSRVHPGETPSSFVCEGIINYLVSNSDDAKKLRDNFIFKIVPMLNPDGVINGNYRCSLSGYDLNRVWHYDNKQSSPEIYYTKRAILDQEKCFMFIDLHAHSKKKGVFMYGCQNRASPFISRHIPYLFWKEIPSFNYYQCNFGMRIGREGTSRLSVHRLLNLPYSYTMEHSFCSPIKEKYHFTSKHYREIGSSLCATLRKYFCNREDGDEIYKELYANKDLGKVGDGEDGNSSEDSQLDAPVEFKELLENRKIIRRKPSSSFRSKIMDASSTPSATKLPLRPPRDLSPRKYYQQQDILQPFINKTLYQPHLVTKKLLQSVPQIPDAKMSEQIEIKGEQVFLSARISQQEDSPQKLQPQTFMLRATSRYEFEEMQSLNNLFLPSLTSASYKRYAKKKNYTKQFVQVGKKYLETNGILKEQIRSVSRKKAGWKDQILTYI